MRGFGLGWSVLSANGHGYGAGNCIDHTSYRADGNGNVTALVNSAGTLQASYRYDPFGRYLSGGGTLATANVLRFSSKPWVAFAGSPTSGLYYYGYRFYDPYLQRWVNQDPLGEAGGINMYSFIHNNPTCYLDHDGRLIGKLLPALIPAAIAAANGLPRTCNMLCEANACHACCNTAFFTGSAWLAAANLSALAYCVTLPYPLSGACAAIVLTTFLGEMGMFAADVTDCHRNCDEKP